MVEGENRLLELLDSVLFIVSASEAVVQEHATKPALMCSSESGFTRAVTLAAGAVLFPLNLLLPATRIP